MKRSRNNSGPNFHWIFSSLIFKLFKIISKEIEMHSLCPSLHYLKIVFTSKQMALLEHIYLPYVKPLSTYTFIIQYTCIVTIAKILYHFYSCRTILYVYLIPNDQSGFP